MAVSPHAPQPLNGVELSKALAPVAALLAISTFINYIDRGSLSLAAPLLKTELQLSPWQLGILLSSFFWTYTGFQIISGWLVDRFNVNWVLASGFFVWTIATATTGVVHGFQMLLIMRLILGAGESVAFPSYSKILAKHFPEALRGRANSFISAGIAGGPAFGIFFGAMLIGKYGWRPFFVVLGLFSLLWLPPWKKWMPTGPGLVVSSEAQMPSIFEILKQRSAWGTFLGALCLQLPFLFSVDLVAVFSGQRAAFFDAENGRRRGSSLSNSGAFGARVGLDFGFVDFARWHTYPCAKDICFDGPRVCFHFLSCGCGVRV